jgi:hypothetical protein
MMFIRLTKMAFASGAALALAACASDGSFPGADLTTSSLQQTKKAPTVDPECIALSAKINELRADGITGRVEKASTGKSKTVSVYRKSLARIAALDRANGDFQRKCSKVPPSSAQQAAIKPPAKATAPAAKPKAPVKTIAKSVAPKPTAAAKQAKPAASSQTAAAPTAAAKETAAKSVTTQAADAAKAKALEAAKAKAMEAAKAKATTVAKKAATDAVVSKVPVGQP